MRALHQETDVEFLIGDGESMLLDMDIEPMEQVALVVKESGKQNTIAHEQNMGVCYLLNLPRDGHVDIFPIISANIVLIHYFVFVNENDGVPLSGESWKECEMRGYGTWKISQSLEVGLDSTDLAFWVRSSSLTQNALSGFADIPGASLAQTTGSQVALDTDDAGYGGFIDYTPYLNEEWLPTSNNPCEWQAKPGSDAP
jgi:hypothetical protein